MDDFETLLSRVSSGQQGPELPYAAYGFPPPPSLVPQESWFKKNLTFIIVVVALIAVVTVGIIVIKKRNKQNEILQYQEQQYQPSPSPQPQPQQQQKQQPLPQTTAEMLPPQASSQGHGTRMPVMVNPGADNMYPGQQRVQHPPRQQVPQGHPQQQEVTEELANDPNFTPL